MAGRGVGCERYGSSSSCHSRVPAHTTPTASPPPAEDLPHPSATFGPESTHAGFNFDAGSRLYMCSHAVNVVQMKWTIGLASSAGPLSGTAVCRPRRWLRASYIRDGMRLNGAQPDLVLRSYDLAQCNRAEGLLQLSHTQELNKTCLSTMSCEESESGPC